MLTHIHTHIHTPAHFIRWLLQTSLLLWYLHMLIILSFSLPFSLPFALPFLLSHAAPIPYLFICWFGCLFAGLFASLPVRRHRLSQWKKWQAVYCITQNTASPLYDVAILATGWVHLSNWVPAPSACRRVSDLLANRATSMYWPVRPEVYVLFTNLCVVSFVLLMSVITLKIHFFTRPHCHHQQYQHQPK